MTDIIPVSESPAYDRWNCTDCGCRTYARVQNGGGEPTDHIRCVHCKRVSSLPIASLSTDKERLIEALTKCRDQFAFYASEHKAKADNAAGTVRWRNTNGAAEDLVQHAEREEASYRAKQLTNERFVALASAALQAHQS